MIISFRAATSPIVAARSLSEKGVLDMKKLLALSVASFVLSTSASALAAEDKATLGKLQDQAQVIVTGKVTDVRSDEFDLDYGPNTITVELDRFGWTGKETKYLDKGESVTVKGIIDDDLFEGREIEAYSVQLNDSYVYYYSEHSEPVYYTYYYSTDALQATVSGKVVKIDDRDVTLKTKTGEMTIDTSALDYDPFDDEGFQKIETGDRIWVTGSIDNKLFQDNEIIAQGLIELSQHTLTK
jgi:uncharacterized protein YdeI (BOF family)